MELKHVIAEKTGRTVYRVDDKCVKVFDKWRSMGSIYREALNHASVEETGLNVPKLLEVTTVDGSWAIITEFVKGKTLAELIEENPQNKNDYLAILVDVQMEIHTKSSRQLPRMKDELHDDIRATQFNATTRYDLHNKIDAMPRSATVCHGDLNLTNVIVTEDGTAYVTGWAHTTRGDALADVAKTYLSFWLRGDITGAERYLEIYCDRSGTEKSNIDSRTSVIAAALTSKCSENEREFLLSLVNKN